MYLAKDDEENCCGLLNLEAGVGLIGILLVGVCCGLFYLCVYYEHFIFFAPLLAITFLYCAFFLVSKLIPGRDNVDTRRTMFMLMIVLSLLVFVYGVLFANEIFNEVPTEICDQNTYMDKKACVGWLTGIRGNLLVIINTIVMLYFTMVHLDYLQQMQDK